MKISIVTPNYNYASFIDQTIKSIINQDYKNWEHIIVDDGSTDNSVEIIKYYQLKFPDKIKLIIQKNKGQTPAINRGLKEISGDIVGWINSDDTYVQDAFNNIINSFKAYPTADAIFGDIIVINKNNETIKPIKYLNFDYSSGVFNGFGKIISSNAIFWKNELISEIGYLNENYRYAMDSEYWSRLLYKKQVIHIDKYIANFRWHEEAITIKRRQKKSIAYKSARHEDKKICSISYNKLLISKFIPFEYVIIFKFYFKLKRHFTKFIKGHYFN